MRAVCRRLKSDYRYSKDIVYNTFPRPDPINAQKAQIEKLAQTILDAREKYPGVSFADMYGEKMYLFGDLLAASRRTTAPLKYFHIYGEPLIWQRYIMLFKNSIIFKG